MKLVTGIQPQEAFPYEDLSQDNAELLALLLSNRDILDSGHRQAESSVLLYRIGHRALRVVGVQLAQDTRAQAFDHGVVAYETISALVRPVAPEYNKLAVGEKTMVLAVADRDSLIGFLQEAEANFGTDQQNTRDVIQESTQRFHPQFASYAVSGAAFAWQFEVETAAA